MQSLRRAGGGNYALLPAGSDVLGAVLSPLVRISSLQYGPAVLGRVEVSPVAISRAPLA